MKKYGEKKKIIFFPCFVSMEMATIFDVRALTKVHATLNRFFKCSEKLHTQRRSILFGNKIDGYRNSKRMAINGMVKRLCKEEEVGYVDMWDSFVGKEEMYVRDGLHLSGKGAAVFAEGLSGAVASGLGKVRYLN